jgi:hypothetical protein
MAAPAFFDFEVETETPELLAAVVAAERAASSQSLGEAPQAPAKARTRRPPVRRALVPCCAGRS